MDFIHKPVLAAQCLELLAIKPDGVYIDATAGGGGHSSLIAEKLDAAKGRLLSLDRDPDAVAAASERLGGFACAEVVRSNYSDMLSAAKNAGIGRADGILMDLGVSSYQLDCADRGFSYHSDAPLDMRMSRDGISAEDVVNTYSLDELTKIMRDYGEEKFAYSIAKGILAERTLHRIHTTSELAEIIRNNVPAAYRREKNPCKKTFQAIRIEVNDEFGHLKKGIAEGFTLLKSGGRFAVITFHSLEDRIVKQAFADFCRGCICPPKLPQCVCGRTPSAKQITRKPITADDTELDVNNRSRSAKLRVIEKLHDLEA